MINLEIAGVGKVKKLMARQQAKIKKRLPEGVKDATLYLHSKIKQSIARGTNASVAVDTGRFLNSVSFAVVDSESSKVYSPISYAKFIEFGTSRMAPRPHFRNTRFKEQYNVFKKFKNKIVSNF